MQSKLIVAVVGGAALLLLLLLLFGVLAPEANELQQSDKESPRVGILFLKTHKTAGSTVSALLSRFALRVGHNSFLVPDERPGRIYDIADCSPEHRGRGRFGADGVDWAEVRGGPPSGLFGGGFPYGMWVNHVRACLPARKKLLHMVEQAGGRAVGGDGDGGGVLQVTIARRPASRLQSAYHWYQHHRPSADGGGDRGQGSSAGLGMSLPAFVEAIGNSSGSFGGSLRNQMPYRTGLDATAGELLGRSVRAEDLVPASATRAQFEREVLEQVRSGRLLVLVAERLPESLLVLRQVHLAASEAMQSSPAPSPLTLSLADLLWVRLKDNRSRYATEPLAESQLAVLDALQPLDEALHREANAALDSLLLVYGHLHLNNTGSGSFSNRMRGVSVQQAIAAGHAAATLLRPDDAAAARSALTADLRRLERLQARLADRCRPVTDGVEAAAAQAAVEAGQGRTDFKKMLKRRRRQFFASQLQALTGVGAGAGDAPTLDVLSRRACLLYALDNADLAHWLRRPAVRSVLRMTGRDLQRVLGGDGDMGSVSV